MKKKSTNLSSSPPSMVSSSRSSPNYEEAATKVGSTLPTDLIMNILSRLPAKSLSKFKCVSKQWFGLITDPYLISTHRALALQNPNLLLLKKAQSIEESKDTQMQISTRISVCSIDFEGNQNFEFVLDLDDDNIDMLPSKWDLICFAGANNGFYVCNPSTQELAKLPEANCCTNGDINAGMGYIKEMNEYVLIHLFDRSLDLQVDYEIGCEIIRWSDGCSIKDRTWKVVEANCSYVVRGWGVLVENVFYWMIWDEYALSGDDAILSFDLEKEEFVTVLPPEWCFDPHGVWFLVELNERLGLVDNSTKPFTMDIWVLNDSKNHSWVKEYCIDLNGFVENSLKFIVPLDHRDGKILIDANLESLEQYDVEKKCFKKMNKLNTRDSTWLRLYTDSFFSLGSQ